MTSEIKKCKKCAIEFTIEPDDFTFYEKIGVLSPTLCPQCRYQRRLVDRNEWSFYKRRCDATGDSIVSIYREDAPFPVYKQEIWKGDSWDPLMYGRAFNFQRPFFEQYEELRQVVPHLALVNSNSVNSEYSNQSQDNKDCYMVSATGSSEKCMYGNWYQKNCYWCSDCSMVVQCEFCYECINCTRCSMCMWCQDCYDSISLKFCNDCRNCRDCFGCVGLRNKQYCWENQQLSKEEYEQRLQGVVLSYDVIVQIRNKLRELTFTMPRKYYHGAKVVDASGDYIENAENARNNFNTQEIKDSSYIQDAGLMTDCSDCTEILKSERSYEVQGCAYINRSIALRSCWTMTDCHYCDMCFSCSDCFGCFGLKQKQYCILNKQYSPEEYIKLKEKIIEHMKRSGEWGEYFPLISSPFAYNESVAQIYFELSKQEALNFGYSWYEGSKEKTYKPTITVETLPSIIKETNDSVLKEVIQCSNQRSEADRMKYSNCAYVFRIIPLELDLYRKLGVPLPNKCFPCRRVDRFRLFNPRRLYHRQCECNTAAHFHGDASCSKKFETTYAPDRSEIVYCEQCYNAEIS